MKNLVTRALTGALYVILLVGCTVYSPLSAFFFFALVAVATLWEFSTLMNRHAGASIVRHFNAMAGLILVSAVWLHVIGSESAGKMFGLYILVMLYMMISELYRRADDPLKNWTLIFASQLYAALPFALLPMLSVSYDAGEGRYVYSWIYPLALFIFIWTNDTGAYLCGSALHNVFPAKLFPRISPKKSWIGSIGGGLLTVGASALIWYLCPDSLSLYKWMGLALVVVFFGTWGDLVESMMKREFGIKDSGNVLPGHGGLLDRFDSALLCIPASVAYFMLING